MTNKDIEWAREEITQNKNILRMVEKIEQDEFDKLVEENISLDDLEAIQEKTYQELFSNASGAILEAKDANRPAGRFSNKGHLNPITGKLLTCLIEYHDNHSRFHFEAKRRKDEWDILMGKIKNDPMLSKLWEEMMMVMRLQG